MEVDPGFRSRCQAWKNQVWPARMGWAGLVGIFVESKVNAKVPMGPLFKISAGFRLKRPVVPDKQSLPSLPGGVIPELFAPVPATKYPN